MTDERRSANLVARLAWAARKARSKDRGYPVRRLSYEFRKRAVDKWFPRPGLDRHAEFRIPGRTGLREHFVHRMTPAWHFRPSETSDLVSRIPERLKNRTIAEARAIVKREFDVFGHGLVLVDPMNWDFANRGDTTWTGYLNRHAAFEQLGFAFHYTSDDQFAQTFLELVESWIESNADRIGRIDWDTPFDVGRRINSWIWAFFLFQEWEGWSGESRQGYLRTLGLLTEYLYQTLEYHSPGNHILLEAKALVLCAEIFPEFAGATRWKRKAWEILSREIDAQVCADGVHVERATMYHRVVGGELAELWLFCERNDLGRFRELGEVVGRMAEFQRWIDLGNGEYPLLGDSRAKDNYYRFSAPAILAARHGGSLILEDGVADHSWWVTGESICSTPGERSTSLGGGGRAFPEGGYFVSRSSRSAIDDVLVWDCGPLGYRANRKHGHADALSFVLSVAAEPILIDPGVGGPKADGRRVGEMADIMERWRELRTTRAHNTVLVDGEDQAILADRNEIWLPPEPRLLLWSTTEEFDVMGGRHDGYARLDDPVVHTRLILASRRGYWVVMDALRGREVHQVDVRYHLAAGATLDPHPSEATFRVRKNAAEVDLTFFETGKEPESLVFHEERLLGEMRDGYPDQIVTLCASRRGELPFVCGTVITLPGRVVRVLSSGRDNWDASLEIQSAEDRDLIRIRMGVQPAVDIQRFDSGLVRNGHWLLGAGQGESREIDRGVA